VGVLLIVLSVVLSFAAPRDVVTNDNVAEKISELTDQGFDIEACQQALVWEPAAGSAEADTKAEKKIVDEATGIVCVEQALSTAGNTAAFNDRYPAVAG
jgi:predicted ABC-type ATPase